MECSTYKVQFFFKIRQAIIEFRGYCLLENKRIRDKKLFYVNKSHYLPYETLDQLDARSAAKIPANTKLIRKQKKILITNAC